MGERVCCPDCHNSFHIHGFEDVQKCNDCNKSFNPKRNRVTDDEDWRSCYGCHCFWVGESHCPRCGSPTQKVFNDQSAEQ